MQRKRTALATFAVMVALAWAVPQLASGQVQSNADETLTIHVSDMPLGELMRSLAEVSPFTKLTLDPGSESQRVTLSLDRVGLREALATILRAADVDYALVGTTRLVVRGADGRLAEIRISPRPASATSKREEVETPTEQAPPLVTDASDSSEINPADQAAQNEAVRQAEASAQAMQYVLSGPPPVAPLPGNVIELPFPGPNGAPLTAIVPPKGTPVVLPFPAASSVSPATPGTPAPAPPRSTDPDLQRLYEVLAPQPGRTK